MAIVVTKTADGYVARVTSPHGGGTNWSTIEPMELAELIKNLRALGCHQTDIGDALYQADPDWVSKLSE